MKKFLTLLIFVFLTSGMLFGQCPDLNSGDNSNKNFLNLNYSSAALRNMALASVESITFPAGTGCNCGATVTILKTAVAPNPRLTTAQNGASSVFRLRGTTNVNDYFDDNNGDYDVVFNLTGGGTLTCTFEDNALVLSTLPVELISFAGTKKDRQINLNWKTASELNNDGFIIEKGDKTAYGMEWNRFGFIQGNGTTQEAQTYSFIDQRPEEGFNYYRLKQMDFDGAYEYSSIIAVDYDKEAGSAPIAIFPNPAKGELIVENGVGQATIFNVLGKPVKQLTVTASQATIELSDLINGQYYLQVLQADGTTVMKQFVKMD